MKDEIQKLIEYIDVMMQYPQTAEIDLGNLSEDYQELGMRLQKLQQILEHMNRQAELLIRGDIYQEGDVPGGVSPTFTDMIQEMRKRSSALENERNLFIQFTESAKERIVVLDERSGEMLFGNRAARKFYEDNAAYMDSSMELNRRSGCSSMRPYSQWDHEVRVPNEKGETETEFYQVNSIYIMWETHGAIAHMFSDMTEIRKAQEIALRDPMTGTYNRRYAMDYLNRMEKEERPFSLGFIDVDYLKYCNDAFGHYAGDMYLVQVVELLQQMDGESVVCRTGGDEFLVISTKLRGEDLALQLRAAREKLAEEMFDSGKKIHKSFSYGIASFVPGVSTNTQEILALADERMYHNKLQNKKKSHMVIQDDRI